MASLIVPANSEVILGKQLTPFELEILQDVLKPDTSVQLIIPDSIEPGKLWNSLDVCCRVVNTLKGAGDKLKPLMGRMLVVLEKYPEVVMAKGYKNFDHFLSEGMNEMFGISRSEAYHCKKIAVCFPSLTTEEFKQIGVAKLQKLCQVTQEGDRRCEDLVDYAKTHTVAEVTHRVMEIKGDTDGDTEITTVWFTCTVETARKWKQFISSPEIRAYCESELPGVIFDKLLQEAEMEWLAAGRHALSGGR